MNILILQSSPRENGNTAWMAEEYKKAATANGHQVTIVNIAKKKISGCMACEYCHTKGNGVCIQKDDMHELYPLIGKAEVLVLATPIYYFSFNAQMHAAIQRIYPSMKPLNVKKMALLLSSHSAGVYDAAIKEFELLCSFWNSINTGTVTAMANEQKTEETRKKIQEIANNL